MNPRKALFTHIRTFFDVHLRGQFSYDDLRVRPAEDAPKIAGKRRYAYGRTKEIVQVAFGHYELSLLSSVEAPPLGRIELSRRTGETVESLVTGPIDPTTFERVAIAIKSGAIASQQRERVTT